MNDQDETKSGAAEIADLARRGADLVKLELDSVYKVTNGDGSYGVLSTFNDEYRSHPRVKSGAQVVYDTDSFLAYLRKHATAATEIVADPRSYVVQATIDAHGEVDAGWRAHRVSLHLVQTPQWKVWTSGDGKMSNQSYFADLVEQRVIDFVVPNGRVAPSGAEMLELAQHFHATKNASFDRSQRLQSGETSLSYVESVEASAGRKGDLRVPDEFFLALQPFEGSKVFQVCARFRYRLVGAELSVGYVLERPDDVQRTVFSQIVDDIRAALSDEDLADLALPIFQGPAT